MAIIPLVNRIDLRYVEGRQLERTLMTKEEIKLALRGIVEATDPERVIMFLSVELHNQAFGLANGKKAKRLRKLAAHLSKVVDQ